MFNFKDTGNEQQALGWLYEDSTIHMYNSARLAYRPDYSIDMWEDLTFAWEWVKLISICTD